MSPLERRYRRLLRFYPARYRAERADEILGTLLESATPEQRRPGVRESAALAASGVRARAASNASLPAVASIRLAAMLGSAAYLAITLCVWASQLIAELFHQYGAGPDGVADARYQALICASLGAATVLIWFVPRRAAALVLLAVLAGALLLGLHRWLLILTVLVLVALTTLRSERPPKAWLWWLAVPVAFFLPGLIGVSAARFAVVGLPPLMLAAFLLAPVVWTVTDTRPALALGVLLAWFGLSDLGVRHLGRSTALDKVAFLYLALGVLAAMPFALREVRRHRGAFR